MGRVFGGLGLVGGHSLLSPARVVAAMTEEWIPITYTGGVCKLPEPEDDGCSGRVLVTYRAGGKLFVRENVYDYEAER